MAKKSRQSFLKRQRERDRQEKAALKRKKRLERRQKQADDEASEGAENHAIDADAEDVAIATDRSSGAETPRASEEGGGEFEESGAREAGGAVGSGGR